jgi:hypothetical protein
LNAPALNYSPNERGGWDEEIDSQKVYDMLEKKKKNGQKSVYKEECSGGFRGDGKIVVDFVKDVYLRGVLL